MKPEKTSLHCCLSLCISVFLFHLIIFYLWLANLLKACCVVPSWKTDWVWHSLLFINKHCKPFLNVTCFFIRLVPHSIDVLLKLTNEKMWIFFYADRTVPFLPKPQLLPITFDFRYLLLTGDRVFNPSSHKVRRGGGGETVSYSI